MRYTTGAIILHWGIGILIAMNYAAAWSAEDMPKPQQLQVMANHKAIGITVLVLTIVRIVWRLLHAPPPLSPTLKTWEAGLAKAVHSLFYIVMVAVPLAGWSMHLAETGGQAVRFFGLFSYPGLPIAENKMAGEILHAMHAALANVMLALIGLHVIGALKHQFWDHDGEMRRMWFGRGQKTPDAE